jgi:hypothetical protein
VTIYITAGRSYMKTTACAFGACLNGVAVTLANSTAQEIALSNAEELWSASHETISRSRTE